MEFLHLVSSKHFQGFSGPQVQLEALSEPLSMNQIQNKFFGLGDRDLLLCLERKAKVYVNQNLNGHFYFLLHDLK